MRELNDTGVETCKSIIIYIYIYYNCALIGWITNNKECTVHVLKFYIRLVSFTCMLFVPPFSNFYFYHSRNFDVKQTYELLSSSFRSFLHPPFNYSLLCPGILLSPLPSTQSSHVLPSSWRTKFNVIMRLKVKSPSVFIFTIFDRKSEELLLWTELLVGILTSCMLSSHQNFMASKELWYTGS